MRLTHTVCDHCGASVEKIIEATELELYGFYLSRDWDELYSFPEYKRLCAEQGTKIIEEGGAE